ncbi:WXG100 family type VII secretion target [Streptomyces angustmyceticus]|uniref:WXG100 family type VII secretion target n=1 Tax=Streptomyces angustmyceticus TaxID=285578 RepID=UPI00368888AA
MAGSGYDVDPAVLKSQGGAFKGIGSDFSDAAKKLAATLKEAEDWGDDDLIKYFMDVYAPVSAGLVESMPTLGEGLSTIGERLEATGEHYATTEQDQHDHLAKYAASRPRFAN